jgi:hypothetical protein
MTLLRIAGPRGRLLLLRQRVTERAAPTHRYVVWLRGTDAPISDFCWSPLPLTVGQLLHAGPRYQAAAQAFEIEAAYQGWQAAHVGRGPLAVSA